MKQEQRLIALDLDGTLLSMPDRISAANSLALEKAAEAGHILCVVTGRPMTVIPDVVHQLSCIRYFAGATGAHILDRETGERLAFHVMSPQTVQKICAVIKQARCGVILCYEKCRVMERGDLWKMLRRRPPDRAIRGVQKCRLLREYLSGVRFVKDISAYAAASGEPLLKCELLLPDGAQSGALLERLLLLLEVAPVTVGPHSIEITAKQATKGRAIELLCRRHSLPRERAVGFGDSGNDMSMRPAVGTLVAMDNASEELKEIADYLAPHAGEDGVARLLEHLGLTGNDAREAGAEPPRPS